MLEKVKKIVPNAKSYYSSGNTTFTEWSIYKEGAHFNIIIGEKAEKEGKEYIIKAMSIDNPPDDIVNRYIK